MARTLVPVAEPWRRVAASPVRQHPCVSGVEVFGEINDFEVVVVVVELLSGTMAQCARRVNAREGSMRAQHQNASAFSTTYYSQYGAN